MGIYQKDECRRAMMTARRHFPLHNNEPELIDNFALPLGSENQSALPEWHSNAAERLRATCESRCRSLCMLQRMNTGIRKFTAMPPGKVPVPHGTTDLCPFHTSGLPQLTGFPLSHRPDFFGISCRFPGCVFDFCITGEYITF